MMYDVHKHTSVAEDDIALILSYLIMSTKIGALLSSFRSFRLAKLFNDSFFGETQRNPVPPLGNPRFEPMSAVSVTTVQYLGQDHP